MSDKMIGIKELHRNLKSVSEEVLRGQRYLVIRNSKPVFKIVPLENDKLPKYSLKDIKKLQFESRSKNLSKNVDNVLY
jgi:antitoxin (DNA-binding transcriptional repressor) of toxin-antitoxin stability system